MYETLIKLCADYFTLEEIELIQKAYSFAYIAHDGQFRQGGEPYIIHPVYAAYYVLTKYHLYDVNTVCAALLHDTIEDTPITYNDILNNFNSDIANLVLNVTNSNNITYKNKDEKEFLNNAMILRNMIRDIRTIIIKSSDRLHNMETLEYKELENRTRKAIQTFRFYVPLNYAIGANVPAQELEDLCFKFMNNEEYNYIVKLKTHFEQINASKLENMAKKLQDILLLSNIPLQINTSLKSNYKLFKDLPKYHCLAKIPNFLTSQIIVATQNDCYKVLECLKNNYNVQNINDNIEDISLNKYQVLSLDIDGFKDYRLSIEIYTEKMYLYYKCGYASILNKLRDKDIKDVHKIIKVISSFFCSLNELSEFYCNNIDLIKHAEEELLGVKISVRTKNNKTIKLPEGSTILDFAYYLNNNLGNTASGAYINGNLVDINYVLQNNDYVEVLSDPLIKRTKEEINLVKTTKARRKILERIKN